MGQQCVHLLHRESILVFLYQYIQSRQTRRPRIKNHQFFDFGELVVVDVVEEGRDAFIGLIFYMRGLFVEIIL
jgi:hypothetical protein